MGVVKPGVNVINYFLFSFEISKKEAGYSLLAFAAKTNICQDQQAITLTNL
jgi:hypothetical protein